MSFEFERYECVEVYTALISAGLELSQDSHQRLTELCQCTRNLKRPLPGEIVGVELEVLTRGKPKPAEVAVEELAKQQVS
ncbi:MAG TPA: hypothetical protein VM554_07650 [Acidisarcina sp.]|nr:hypothetical protein [Acidisarcina sp.]